MDGVLRARFLIFLLIPVLTIGGCGRRRPEGPVSNVILIVVDTLRPDHLGCYGRASIRTPAIDDLALHGTLFEQAASPVPITLPSFCSLLSSTYPPTHGVRDNGRYTLSDEIVTLAEVLREEGFRTAAFLGSAVLDSMYGLGQGFDRYDDDLEDLYHPYRSDYRMLAGNLRGTERRADVVTGNALSWMKAHRRDRFFVMLHYFDPHAFYDPPPPFDSLYARDMYDGEIAYTDSQIDLLMRTVGSLDLPGRTLVVLTADHGEGLMEHQEAQHGFLIYDSTVRVPLIFSCPGICPEGLRIADPVCLVDVAPSILSLVGVPRPRTFQGGDLCPSFVGTTPDGVGETYCETLRPRLSHGWSDLAGIRKDGWKYIRAPRPELYHLVDDPAELSDLAGSGLPVEASLAARLSELLDSFPADPRYRALDVSMDDRAREKLESLGYLMGSRESSCDGDEGLPNPRDMMEAFNRNQQASYQARIGWSLLDAGRPEDALAAFRSAVELEPDSPLRLVDLGSAYARMENVPEAAAAFERALRIDPGYGIAHLGLARVYELREDGNAAAEEYRAALAVSPDLEEAVLGLEGLERARNRPERARAVLEEALEREPNKTVFLSHLIQVLRDSGSYKESVPYLERLAAIQPLDPDAPFYLAHTLAGLGDTEGALRWYARVIELDPNAVDAYYNIACIYGRTNREDAAIEWLKNALDHGFTDLAFMKTDPDLESLHSDPRFQSLF